GFEDTLRSRLAAGLLADIEPPDPALRLALVRRKAAEAGLELDDEVASHVAEHWCRNGRELEGVLKRIEASATLAQRPVTLGLVRGARAPYRGPDDTRKSLARIVGEVCRQYQVTRAELASSRRTARVVLPRHIAMYLCRRHTDAPLGVIGKELGGRDHSTVVQALGAIEERLRTDAELRGVGSMLEERRAERGWWGSGGGARDGAARRPRRPQRRGRLGARRGDARVSEGVQMSVAILGWIEGDLAHLVGIERVGHQDFERGPEQANVDEMVAAVGQTVDR